MAELRACAYLDSLQPQLAAVVGAVSAGDIPLEKMAALYIELAPGTYVYPALDVAIKSAPVKSGLQIIEREFGLFEIHAESQADVKRAKEAVLNYLAISEENIYPPVITAAEVVTSVTPYQAQLINRSKMGSLLLPGQSLLVIEIEPAAYSTFVANEAEKASDVNIVDLWYSGLYGRLFLGGNQGDILTAADAVYKAVESIS